MAYLAERRRQEIERREKWLKAWLRRQHCPHCAASLETLGYTEPQLTAKGMCETLQPMREDTKILSDQFAKSPVMRFRCAAGCETARTLHGSSFFGHISGLGCTKKR
jgi:hypothetical protein